MSPSTPAGAALHILQGLPPLVSPDPVGVVDHSAIRELIDAWDLCASCSGVAQNYSEAAKWYRKAAEQGISLAQFSLGLMYYHGQGVLQSYDEAYHWWAKREARR